MNTNRTHQIRTATLATVIAFVACASTAAPAFARADPRRRRGRLWNQRRLAVRRADRGSRRDDAGGVRPEAPGRRPPHPHRGVPAPSLSGTTRPPTSVGGRVADDSTFGLGSRTADSDQPLRS